MIVILKRYIVGQVDRFEFGTILVLTLVSICLIYAIDYLYRKLKK